MSPVIHCENLSRRFRRIHALEDLQLDVPEGSIYALIGPNGAGKTTLIRVLLNVLRPSAGRALLLETDSRQLGPEQLAHIGYVSENQDLPGWMTVAEYLTYLKPFYPTWDDALARDLLRELQLATVMGRRLGSLSRGMKMKVALASSLAYHPRLILLDEPFSGLDPLVRDELIRGLLDRAGECSVFVSSHDLAELESFASHVGFLDAGRLLLSEETAALANRCREIEVTLPSAPPPRSNWPNHWLDPQLSGSMVRFVETSFDRDRTASSISEFLPGATNVAVNPMSLREIFVALARKQRMSAA